MFGKVFLKDIPGVSNINVTDETTQAELDVHMAFLGVTYMTVAFYLMVGVVMHGELNMGNNSQKLELLSYEQAHVMWFLVKEVCVDLSERGEYTFKGVETTAAEDSSESNASIVKAKAETRMEVLEGLLEATTREIGAQYVGYFFVNHGT